MELNRTIKQGLSILQAQISDQSDYILITNEKAVSKHKVFTKTDGGWEDITNTCEPSDILSDVGLNKSEEVNLIKNENMILKKKIDELNSKILQLEEEEEEEAEEEEGEEEEGEEEEVVIKKKKKSGKSASQEKIKDDIIKYINNNRITDDDSLPEDFNDFSVTMDENDSDRIETLKNIFDKMAGSASESVYRSFIELELLHKLYLKKFGNKMGKNLAREDLSRIITTKKKPSAYFRKASRFYFICKHLKKGVWKECALAPTYWESINGTTWDSILENLNTENLSEEENSE